MKAAGESTRAAYRDSIQRVTNSMHPRRFVGVSPMRPATAWARRSHQR
jgi:hypothetical protein